MFVIALTGGIASGKSTVAELFSKHDIEIIDADKIVRELTSINQPAYLSIINYFGQKILLPEGNLDRKKLRTIIFNDAEKRKWLEHLLHPQVWQEIQERVLRATSPYCLAVIPLLLETGPHPLIQRILVIDVSEEQQIERLKKRDHTNISEVQAILKTQMTREHKLKAAHDIIKNTGHQAELATQVEQLHQKYLKLAEKNSPKER